jgi:hypothetical protein
MTLNELNTSINTLLTRVGSNRITGSDILTAVQQVISYFATQISEIIPEWEDTLTFQTDGSDAGKYCVYPDTNGKQRIWETVGDDNINNLPPSNPATTSNAFWAEVSASATAAIPEWAAGVYGPGLVIVFHNHTTDGRGLYVLIEPTRPYASSNIETEITAGDWERIGGTSTGTGGPAIDAEYANIAAMLADQANQEQDALYFVADASADATVDADWALYQKLAASTGAIGDYRKLSEKESLDVVLNVLATTLTGFSVGANSTILSSDTILQAFGKAQGQINERVDKETFATLTDGASVTWNTNNKQNPLAKLTSTQSFTIDMTNVKSGSSGILKLIKNTASDVILTFDTSFTNKQTNATLVNYTFSGASGTEYFLSFIAEGTNIEWVIADPVTTTLPVPSWARVRRTTAQSYSNGTLAAISWDTEDADNNAIWALSPNPTRFVIPGSGSKIVTISVFAAWAGNITGLRRLWIHKNGASITGALGDQMFTAPVGTETYMQRTFQIEATGGDYIEVMALQVSTTTLNLNSAQCSIKVESL